MSRRGLELYKDLLEIRDAVTSLDNICGGAAAPFGSADFTVFTANKRNVSVFSFIPDSYSLQLSSYGGIANTYRIEVPRYLDVSLDLINLNIAVGDIVIGEGIQPNTVIERIDVIQNETNRLGFPTTELLLTKQLTATIPENSAYTLVKQNSATIEDNRFVLGKDLQHNFYNGDKITAVYYPLSTSTDLILNTINTDLYVVDNIINNKDQFCFGLSPTIGGQKIDLSTVNSLCAINLLRSNEVTSENFRNVFLPEPVDYMDSDPSSGDGIENDANRNFYSLIKIKTVKEALEEIEQKADYTSSVLTEKIYLDRDNITNKNINIEGVLKVADPGVLNYGVINTTNNRAPSIYILDPATGSLDNKVRIFSTFDSPWITTNHSLSSSKNINVGSLAFEKTIFLENATVTPIDSTPVQVSFTRKIPVSITDSTGFTSTYFLLASSQL